MFALRSHCVRLGSWLICAGVLSTSALAQTTWYVDVNGTPPGTGTQVDPYTSIQYALEQATTVHGDTLLVAPGTYAETLDFLGKAVAVRASGGAAQTTIDAQQAGSVVSCVSGEGPGSVLEGFTLQNGSGTSFLNALVGGGLLCVASSPTIVGCHLRMNTADEGAGVFLFASAAAFSACVVEDNLAETGPGFEDGLGGGFHAQVGSDFTLVACTVRANTAGIGAGLWLDGSRVTMTDCLVEGNAAVEPYIGAGGGLFADGNAVCMLERCAFRSNRVPGSTAFASYQGGGLFLGDVTAVLVECEVSDNVTGTPRFDTPGEGGGIYATPFADLSATDCLFERNIGHIAGGGIHGIGSFEGCTIAGGESQFGGGVYATSAQLTLTDCVIRDNFATSRSGTGHFGAGVYGPALLTRCRVLDNIAFGEGGGVYGATLFDCELRGNQALWADFCLPGRGGGAIDALLIRCRLAENVAEGAPCTRGTIDGEGGGACDSTLSFCVVEGNEADVGGGTFDSTLERCTVYGNVALVSGGGASQGSARDSIFWANVPEAIRDPGGTMVVEYCDVEGGFPGTGNIAADPAFWRAEARDFHLRPGSPCIDTGDPASPLDPDGSRADMGAHAFDPAYLPAPWRYCTAKTNSCGASPELTFTGEPSASATSGFTLTGSGARLGNAGILLYTANGPGNAPFQGGILCVSPTGLRRGPAVTASGGAVGACDSSFALDMNAFASGNAGGNPALFLLSVGQRVNVQWWGRDTLQHGSYLSAALEYFVGP